jgi:N-acyl homoserine lactone hydrolase
MNGRFELLDGDAELVAGLSVIATPGHTSGHQSVLVRGEEGVSDLLIGDAAYTPVQYHSTGQDLPPGQADDLTAWRGSIRRIHDTAAARVHFCHHTDVVHR